MDGQQTKLYERVTENITVTEEEVQDEYDTRVAEMKETYAESPNSFEQDMMNGATIYYRPAGFREIKQILIAFNEEDSETIATLQKPGRYPRRRGSEKRLRWPISRKRRRRIGFVEKGWLQF